MARGTEDLIGGSPGVEKARRLIRTLAAEPLPVLIEGETGTGKELVAKGLHVESGRTGAFVPVNCATLSDTLMESELFGHERGSFTGAVGRKQGMVEAAAGGTLFLDEVSELPAALQAKLLRVLDEGLVRRVGANRAHRVDFRVVAATNRNLALQMQTNGFRDDLYHRLKGGYITMPPLRERLQDITLLVEHFLRGRAVPAKVIETLRRYQWPGNVRELRHVLAYANAMAGRKAIGLEHLPEDVRWVSNPDAGAPDSMPVDRASPDLPLFEFHGVRPLDELEADYAQMGPSRVSREPTGGGAALADRSQDAQEKARKGECHE